MFIQERKGLVYVTYLLDTSLALHPQGPYCVFAPAGVKKKREAGSTARVGTAYAAGVIVWCTRKVIGVVRENC